LLLLLLLLKDNTHFLLESCEKPEENNGVSKNFWYLILIIFKTHTQFKTKTKTKTKILISIDVVPCLNQFFFVQERIDIYFVFPENMAREEKEAVRHS
jgi:hypothetical protein